METTTGEDQDPGIIEDLLYLAMDLLPEHQDLPQPAVEDLHTLFMKDLLCQDATHLLPEHPGTDLTVAGQEQFEQPLETIVRETLGDITQGRGMILQTHFDYAPNLENIVIHKGAKEDSLTGNQEFTSRQKLGPTRPASKSRSPQPEPEPPHTLDESLEMKIPPSVDIPPVDWSQLTPELLEQGQGEEQPLPGERPTWMDWTTVVKQAYEDLSRTRAACELVHAGIICLAQKVRTEKFETFLRILHTRNPDTPQMILGNMASIFAYSGKMTRTQAGGSYTFKVSGSFGFGLVVPTLFRQKPGFRDDSSKVFHLIHGTTSQGASRILAEDLIRRGDFSMHQDHLLQSDFPTYGHCSMGRQAADTTLSPLQVKQFHLIKTTLRTTQGSMAAFAYGIYTGLHPHQNHRVDSNDEAQVLCGKYGIARDQYLWIADFLFDLKLM